MLAESAGAADASADPRVRAGIQLHLPTYRTESLADIRAIAQRAADVGFGEVWVTDNLSSRSALAVLCDLAPRVQVDLGTAILAQYLRSPFETARALTCVSELMDGRALHVGIGAGNPSSTRLLETPKPGAFMRETTECLRLLLSGKPVELAAFPLLAAYFRMSPTAVVSGLPAAPGPTQIYGGGNGPRGLDLAGGRLDGVILGWTLLPAILLDRLAPMVSAIRTGAEAAGRTGLPTLVGEVKLSLAQSTDAARDFARAHAPSLASRWLGLRTRGYGAAELAALGMTEKCISVMESAVAGRALASEWLGDELMDSFMIVGDPTRCRERVEWLAQRAQAQGVSQLMFSELGPDPLAAVTILGETVLPALRETRR